MGWGVLDVIVYFTAFLEILKNTINIMKLDVRGQRDKKHLFVFVQREETWLLQIRKAHTNFEDEVFHKSSYFYQEGGGAVLYWPGHDRGHDWLLDHGLLTLEHGWLLITSWLPSSVGLAGTWVLSVLCPPSLACSMQCRADCSHCSTAAQRVNRISNTGATEDTGRRKQRVTRLHAALCLGTAARHNQRPVEK